VVGQPDAAGGRLTRSGDAFDREVAAVLAGLPEPFRTRAAVVLVEVRDRPTRGELRDAGIRTGSLFGLFTGTPVTEETLQDLPRLPACITLYRRELEEAFPVPAELKAEIRRTLLHELGHFFGLSERDLSRLGYR
jgi:predicted Zn-dependent protease with MMP-like domain